MDWIVGLDGWVGWDHEMSWMPKSFEARTFVPDKFWGCLGVAATAGSRVYKQKSPTVRTI